MASFRSIVTALPQRGSRNVVKCIKWEKTRRQLRWKINHIKFWSALARVSTFWYYWYFIYVTLNLSVFPIPSWRFNDWFGVLHTPKYLCIVKEVHTNICSIWTLNDVQYQTSEVISSKRLSNNSLHYLLIQRFYT